MSGRLRLLAVAPVLAACGSSTSLPIDARCNPLGVTACLAPWPSSAFEIEDDTTATGRRLAIPEDALPRGVLDHEIDPARWNALDGFSATTAIVVAFPGGVSSVGLPASDNMDLSLAGDSPTVILDMTTGERIAHHAEVREPLAQELVLRPAARLAPGHRYAIAITSRVVAADGGDLPVPPGFKALRDDRRTDHALLEAMRPRFDDVLDVLDEAGIPDDELVVAWDFTVASQPSAQRDLVAARELARATLASHPTLHTITDDRRDALGRQLTGTFDGPLFLSNGGELRAGTRLVRDDAGLPAVQGLYRIPFSAIVPACPARAMPLVIWGHGAFGDHTELSTMRSLANDLCMVFVATDLRGLSRGDLPAVQRVVDDLSRADELDTIVQGVIDHDTLVIAMRGVFGELVDRRAYYVGESVALATMPEVERAVIVEPRLERALPGPPDPIDASLVHELIDARWDRVLADGFDRPVLVLARGGDDASWLARSFALPIVGPSPSIPWGVRTVASPRTSGLVLSSVPSPNVIRDFLATGVIAR
jgi:hypothetical protein